MMIKITKTEGLVQIEDGLLDKIVMIDDSPKVYRRILNQSLEQKTSTCLKSNLPARSRRLTRRFYSDFLASGGNVVDIEHLQQIADSLWLRDKRQGPSAVDRNRRLIACL